MKKMISISFDFGSCQAIFSDVLGMKRAATEIVPKLPKFLAKTTSHAYCSVDVDDVQRRSRYAQKGRNW